MRPSPTLCQRTLSHHARLPQRAHVALDEFRIVVDNNNARRHGYLPLIASGSAVTSLSRRRPMAWAVGLRQQVRVELWRSSFRAGSCRQRHCRSNHTSSTRSKSTATPTHMDMTEWFRITLILQQTQLRPLWSGAWLRYVFAGTEAAAARPPDLSVTLAPSTAP